MDVFLKDSNRMFDIEIQTSDYKKLAMRARFYQVCKEKHKMGGRIQQNKITTQYYLKNKKPEF